MRDMLTPEKIMGAPLGTYVFILDTDSETSFVFEKISDKMWRRHNSDQWPTTDNHQLQDALLLHNVVWSMS